MYCVICLYNIYLGTMVIQRVCIYACYIQGVYQPEKLKKNELTKGNHGKLRENDEDSGKIMSIAALS